MNIDSFLIYLQDIKRYSPNTVVAYRKDLDQFLKFCESRQVTGYQEITGKIVRDWVVALMSGDPEGKKGKVGRKSGGVKKTGDGMMPVSVRRKLSAVRTLVHYLMREGVITEDPTDIVVTPKIGKKLPVFVPDYQMDELLDSRELEGDFPQMRDRLVLLMAYFTGMRRSEIVGLKVCDVDFSARNIKIEGKGSKQRIVPIETELIEDIKIYLEKREEQTQGKHTCFFVTDKGTPVYDKFIYRLVVKYLGQVTSLSKRSPHVLRHTFATQLLNNGACIEAIRKLLGHADLTATQIYTHNSFENLIRVFNQAHPRA